MLSGSDIIAGKIIVQLNLASADEVCEQLQALDADPSARWDLINAFSKTGKLDAPSIELVRHRVALYEHVRREAIYVRLLERETTIKKTSVAKLLAQLEAAAFRRRLGDVLVRRGSLKADDDRALVRTQSSMIEKEDRRIIARYRHEDFKGVGKPLIRNSSLAPADFKISTLFRSKETRALVDKAEIELLRAVAAREAERAAAKKAAEEQDITAMIDPNLPGVTSATAETAKLDPTEVAEAKAAAAEELKKTDPTLQQPAIPDAIMSTDDIKSLKRIADYAIVETLGVGGMGAVFLGQKDGAGEYVAIKVLLNQAASEEEKGRFEREITLTQRVQHTNVILIIDTGKTPQGLTYVVVPALAGKELRDLLEATSGDGLTGDLVVRIFTQVLEGMQAVHDAGVVHRDLKPENVFVMAGGQHEVKIMDFGLAKPSEEAFDEIHVFRTMGGEVSGSPAYMAPESVTNDPIDGRTDIYSLGVMLFEMLTGKLPLESETSQGYLTQHLICPPLTLAEAAPDRNWHPDLEALLEAMLAKTRDERPATCNAILQQLASGVAEKIRKIDEPSEDARAEEALSLESPAAMNKWGFKGLLGRLLGNA